MIQFCLQARQCFHRPFFPFFDDFCLCIEELVVLLKAGFSSSLCLCKPTLLLGGSLTEAEHMTQAKVTLVLCRSFPLIQTHSHLLRFCPSFSFLQDKAKYTKTQREMNILGDISEILERKRRKKIEKWCIKSRCWGSEIPMIQQKTQTFFFMVLETKVCLVFKTFIDPYCVLIDELLNFK